MPPETSFWRPVGRVPIGFRPARHLHHRQRRSLPPRWASSILIGALVKVLSARSYPVLSDSFPCCQVWQSDFQDVDTQLSVRFPCGKMAVIIDDVQVITTTTTITTTTHSLYIIAVPELGRVGERVSISLGHLVIGNAYSRN